VEVEVVNLVQVALRETEERRGRRTLARTMFTDHVVMGKYSEDNCDENSKRDLTA
jgi:hypothetical protein